MRFWEIQISTENFGKIISVKLHQKNDFRSVLFPQTLCLESNASSRKLLIFGLVFVSGVPNKVNEYMFDQP